jgi:DNA invertase Pin-like site-specific DNA recombinase
MTARTFGYARVSTLDQKLETQRAALMDAGVDEIDIHEDKKSGRTLNRDGLNLVLRLMRKGDTLVVWRFDRLARNARDLLSVTDDLSAKGIEFRSIKEGVDTKTPAGKLMLTMIAAMAQFESDVNSERTKAGMAFAAKQGRRGGRKHYILTYPKRLARFTELWLDGAIPDSWMSAEDIVAEMNGITANNAPRIKSLGMYVNWKAKGFPGFEKPEKEPTK